MYRSVCGTFSGKLLISHIFHFQSKQLKKIQTLFTTPPSLFSSVEVIFFSLNIDFSGGGVCWKRGVTQMEKLMQVCIAVLPRSAHVKDFGTCSKHRFKVTFNSSMKLHKSRNKTWKAWKQSYSFHSRGYMSVIN